MRRVLLPPALAPETALADGRLHDYRGESMGTSWSVRLVARGAAPALQQGLQQQLDEVVAQMSHWEPDSDLGRFNRATALTWQQLPSAFYEVLDFALAVARASGGACDPCAGALVNLWGFGPRARYDQPGFLPPSRAQVEAVRARLAGRTLQLDPARRRAWQPGGVQLDLSAVAKGYGVDCLARYLAAQGIANYLVEVGGELRGAGVKPDGQPWWVALEQPAGADAAGQIVVALHGLAVATSGDYRRYFMRDAARFPHTIDPRSGWPISNQLAAVTVLHEQAMAADAWSTALTVLGPDQGLALAEQQGLAARFLQRRDDSLHEVLSSRFRTMLEAE
jgi:thiamine biosynthesis lipoprotein